MFNDDAILKGQTKYGNTIYNGWRVVTQTANYEEHVFELDNVKAVLSFRANDPGIKCEIYKDGQLVSQGSYRERFMTVKSKIEQIVSQLAKK